MRRVGIFSTGYDIRVGSKVLARVDRLGVCLGGWTVTKVSSEMEAPDMILVGLIYHIIAKRQQQAAAAHGS
jgi:hypothetical protein